MDTRAIRSSRGQVSRATALLGASRPTRALRGDTHRAAAPGTKAVGSGHGDWMSPAEEEAYALGMPIRNGNALDLDAAYAADPDAMKESDPDLAYYIGHGDHNPDGSG